MIKFRVWNEKLKKYISEEAINLLQIGFINKEKINLEQFTGLQDKNGVDIYVGDIVYYARDDENYLIGYDIGNAMYSISNCKETMNFDNLYSTDLEVIGNINENKEILK